MQEISALRLDHLKRVDALPAQLRECVHDFGFPIVNAFMECGVRSPAKIRQLIGIVLSGIRERSQSGKNGSGLKHVVDDLLIQSGSGMTAKGFASVLRINNVLIIPAAPNKAMIEASIDAVDWSQGKISKSDKHSRRLNAALHAGARAHWGFE